MTAHDFQVGIMDVSPSRRRFFAYNLRSSSRYLTKAKFYYLTPEGKVIQPSLVLDTATYEVEGVSYVGIEVLDYFISEDIWNKMNLQERSKWIDDRLCEEVRKK